MAAHTWTDVEAGASTTLLAVPVGATEQHGPHLPLSTDTDVAVHLAGRLAAGRSGVLVTPAVAFGASGEHAGFPGTLSVGLDVLAQVLVEIGRSADDWAGMVFVSAHGGNGPAVSRAVDLLVREGRRVLAWSPTATAIGRVLPPERIDAHAGLVETSLMLALHPDAVRSERMGRGDPRPLRSVLPELRRSGVRPLSPTGVLGDPEGATAALGHRLLAALGDDLVGATERWAPDQLDPGPSLRGVDPAASSRSGAR